MKIIYLCDEFPPLSFGGAGIIAYEFAKTLKNLGHQVVVITTVQERSLEKEYDFSGLKVYRIYSKYPVFLRAYLSLYNPQVASKIKNIFSEIKPDIVHAHNIHSHISYHALKMAKKSGSRVFLTAHDTMLVSYGKLPLAPQENLKISFFHNLKSAGKRFNPLRNLLIKHYLKYIDCIFAISAPLKNLLVQNGIRNKIEVLHNGINIPDWICAAEKIEEFKDKFNIKNKKIIFFGGRLSGAKGGLQIIKALSYIVNDKKAADVVLITAGDKNSDFAKKMVKLAEKLGVSANVVFTGWLEREELKQALFSSDVCVTPSIYFDPFNLFNIEAMAARKPVVGTCFGGAPEIVVDGKTGYVVNPLDHELMAEKIIDLLSNPEKARQFGETGYKRVQDNFNLEKQAEKLIKFYENSSY